MKKRNLWESMKNHKKAISGLLTLMLCVGVCVAIGGVFPSKETSSTSGEIPEHDGDVLVDSVNVKDEGAGKKGQTEKSTDKKDSSLVTSDDINDAEKSDTYFEEMRATVNMDRNQVISMLTDAEAQAESTGEKENANKQKLKLLNYMEQEQNVENIMKTKKMPDCLVLISDNGVNVTVDKQDLKQTDVAKICDVIMRETGRKASEIIIQSKY